MFPRPSGQADREVKISLGKVNILVRCNQIKARIGVGLAKGRQPCGEPFGGEITRRSNGQRIGRLPRLHRTDRFFELQEPGAQGIKAVCRFVRQFKPLGRAAEQHDAQHILQRADLLTNSGRCDREFVGSLRKAQMPRRSVKHAQTV